MKKNKNNKGNKGDNKKTQQAAPAAPAAAPEVKTEKTAKQASSKQQEKPESKASAKQMNGNEVAAAAFSKLQGTMDANHTQDALRMMHDIAHNNPDAINATQETINDVDRLCFFGTTALIAHDVALGKTPFAIAVSKGALEEMKNVAKFMGLNMDNVKALPGANPDTVVVNTSEMKVDDATKKQIEAEEAVAVEVPELDPEKLASDNASEEDVNKARIYLAKTKSPLDIPAQILSLADFEKKFRTAVAKKGEDAEKRLAKYAEYSVADWLNLFLKTSHGSSLLVRGIAKGFAYTALSYESPIYAFTMLANTKGSKDKDGKSVFDDQQIADIVGVLAKYCIAEEQEENTKLRDEYKGKDSKKYEAAVAQLERCDKMLSAFTNPKFDIVDSFVEGLKDPDSRASKLAKELIKVYYLNTPFSGYDPSKKYKNLAVNLQQYAGIITNLFTSNLAGSSSYIEANITPLEEYSEEELKEMKKQELEAKKAAKAEESKNA